ncbi:MAG: EAL domain-containing protein, partial [Burkholderiaceae bacterium]
TEASLMRDGEKAEQVLSGLQTMGVKIALDNFGTGYSSLSNLRRFPVDIIKIDGQFVRSAPTEPADAKIVAALAHLAHELGFSVVAEGIEAKEQLEFVKACGCDEAQGFLLGRPLSGLAFVDLARRLK